MRAECPGWKGNVGKRGRQKKCGAGAWGANDAVLGTGTGVTFAGWKEALPLGEGTGSEQTDRGKGDWQDGMDWVG